MHSSPIVFLNNINNNLHEWPISNSQATYEDLLFMLLLKICVLLIKEKCNLSPSLFPSINQRWTNERYSSKDDGVPCLVLLFGVHSRLTRLDSFLNDWTEWEDYMFFCERLAACDVMWFSPVPFAFFFFFLMLLCRRLPSSCCCWCCCCCWSCWWCMNKKTKTRAMKS